MDVIKSRAAEKNAPLTILHANEISKLDGIEIGLAGIHQKYNALTAIEVCKIWLKKIRGIEFAEDVPEGFKKGLKEVKWPGRAQQLPIKDTKYANNKALTWYLDGAHTVESLGVCADWFKSIIVEKTSTNKPIRVLVFNCTHGRDIGKLLQVIANIQDTVQFDHVVFTTNITYKSGYSGDNTNNTVSMEEVTSVQQILALSWKDQVPDFNQENVHVVDTIEDAIEFAVDLSNKNENQIQVLTTGSLIMVGNTLTVLGIEPQ
jgi:folylpolyglutamate synthase